MDNNYDSYIGRYFLVKIVCQVRRKCTPEEMSPPTKAMKRKTSETLSISLIWIWMQDTRSKT